jgi:hypothetical protein
MRGKSMASQRSRDLLRFVSIQDIQKTSENHIVSHLARKLGYDSKEMTPASFSEGKDGEGIIFSEEYFKLSSSFPIRLSFEQMKRIANTVTFEIVRNEEGRYYFKIDVSAVVDLNIIKNILTLYKKNPDLPPLDGYYANIVVPKDVKVIWDNQKTLNPSVDQLTLLQKTVEVLMLAANQRQLQESKKEQDAALKAREQAENLKREKEEKAAQALRQAQHATVMKRLGHMNKYIDSAAPKRFSIKVNKMQSTLQLARRDPDPEALTLAKSVSEKFVKKAIKLKNKTARVTSAKGLFEVVDSERKLQGVAPQKIQTLAVGKPKIPRSWEEAYFLLGIELLQAGIAAKDVEALEYSLYCFTTFLPTKTINTPLREVNLGKQTARRITDGFFYTSCALRHLQQNSKEGAIPEAAIQQAYGEYQSRKAKV